MFFSIPLISSSILTRSTGSFIIILPLYLAGHKLLRVLTTNPCQGFLYFIKSNLKGLKYTFIILATLFACGMAILTVTMWKPYEAFCLSRLDTEEQVAEWCYDFMPVIYNYIQEKYWQVGFLKFLERPWYLFATGLFTNSLAILIIFRLVQGQGTNFVLGGLLNKKADYVDVFSSKVMLPFGYMFVINVVTVILFANSEIIGRVATTCPFYFYAWAQLIVENNKGLQGWIVGLYGVYNIVVLALNLFLFTTEIGFV